VVRGPALVSSRPWYSNTLPLLDGQLILTAPPAGGPRPPTKAFQTV